MGGGASTSKAGSMRNVLTSGDALKLSKDLSTDETFRQSFAAFVKSGVWIDFLGHYFAFEEAFLAVESRLVKETGNLMYAYKLPKTKTVSLRGITYEEEEKKQNSSSKYESVVTSFYSDEEGHGQEEVAEHLESYVDIEVCSIFPAQDFLDILLNVLCPIFVWSGLYAQYLKNGPQEGFDEDGDEEMDAILAGPPTTNHLAIRAQELLLGSAAYFEASSIADHLQQPDWAKSIPRVMEGLSLCFTLLDVSQPEPCVVYANKAFTAMTGYKASELVSKNLTEVLAGEDTDELQSEQITLAMQSEMLSKFAITHYNKAGKAFINLVSVKNCGQYTIVVHFPATKRVKMADLNSVDDAIALLACLLTPPTVAQTTSRAVAPVATTPGLLNKFASPLLHAGRKTLSSFHHMHSFCGSSSNDLGTVATGTTTSTGNSNSDKSHIPAPNSSNSKPSNIKLMTKQASHNGSVATMDTCASPMSATSRTLSSRPVVPVLDFSGLHYQ